MNGDNAKLRGWARRRVLQASAAALCMPLLPSSARAELADTERAIGALFGGRAIREGRVVVTLPPISENGYSVPLVVLVDSPMSEQDHVLRIAVFTEKNPLPDVARFELGPRAGIARVETRIRLGASQRIRAVAEMNDGSLWTGYAFTVVTLAACLL